MCLVYKAFQALWEGSGTKWTDEESSFNLWSDTKAAWILNEIQDRKFGKLQQGRRVANQTPDMELTQLKYFRSRESSILMGQAHRMDL